MSEELCKTMREAITTAIEGSQVHVEGGGGHFRIEVVSSVFEGKRSLAKQRLVLSAIAHLMKGDAAPVHAIDQMRTRVPENG